MPSDLGELPFGERAKGGQVHRTDGYTGRWRERVRAGEVHSWELGVHFNSKRNSMFCEGSGRGGCILIREGRDCLLGDYEVK